MNPKFPGAGDQGRYGVDPGSRARERRAWLCGGGDGLVCGRRSKSGLALRRSGRRQDCGWSRPRPTQNTAARTGKPDAPDFGGEFDPGSGSTLAACLMHASRTGRPSGRSRGGRVRNTWAICPEAGASLRKRRVIPYGLRLRVGSVRKGATRLGRSLRPISWTVGSRPTVAMIGSWSERTISHTGTETRPRLLREAAARNFPQWAQA